MTFRILKSQTFAGFDVAVAQFAKDMRDWREQEKKATEHDDKPDIAPIDRWVHRKRPTEDERVMRAVNENDIADFEIIDDSPSPEQILRYKKSRLLADVVEAENAAVSLIVPAGKHRAFALRERGIMDSDAKVIAELMKAPTLLQKVASTIGLGDPQPDIHAEIVKRRPPEDTKFLSDQNDRRHSIQTIVHAATQMHSDIEDLTLDNIDAWKMPDFPK
jgi:hypothetical protein